MKNCIILGIVLMAVVTNGNATNLKIGTENQQVDFSFENVNQGKRLLAPVEDQNVINPDSILAAAKEGQMEFVIAENNRIIESNFMNESNLLFIEKSIEQIIEADKEIIEAGNTTEIRPLYIERTINDMIAEDNAIIENNKAIETQPLDFEKINRDQILKQATTKLFIGMK